LGITVKEMPPWKIALKMRGVVLENIGRLRNMKHEMLNRQYQPPYGIISIVRDKEFEGNPIQVQLYPVAHSVILQCKLVFERPFALPLEQYLVRFAAYSGCYLSFEEFCRVVSQGSLVMKPFDAD
jgi:hypothetical protein